MRIAEAKQAVQGQDWYRATVASQVERKRVPQWVRGFEAWVEGQYPVGCYGHSVAKEIMRQLILHFEQEAELAAAARSRSLDAARSHRSQTGERHE